MNDKIVYIFGAGSTKALGLKTTYEQDEMLKDNIKTKSLLFKFINDSFPNDPKVNDLFNLLDSHISNKRKFKDYEFTQLIEIRKLLTDYIINDFYSSIKNVYKSKNEYHKMYKHFYEELIHRSIKEYHGNIMSRYSIINFNYDLLSFNTLLEANKEINHAEEHTYNNKKLMVYSDFTADVGRRLNAIDDKGTDFSPFPSMAAATLNKENNNSTRAALLIKTIYPHGLMNLYRCSSCGKHISFYLTDNYIKEDKYDYVNKEISFECPMCHSSLKRGDYDILVQSNFKTPGSFYEEKYLDMQNEIRNANTLVFIGYSLPIDDVDKRIMFKTLTNDVKNIKIVLYSKYGKENKFIPYNEAINFDDQKDTIERFAEVFGKDRLSFNFIGSPKCFQGEEIYE